MNRAELLPWRPRSRPLLESPTAWSACSLHLVTFLNLDVGEPGCPNSTLGCITSNTFNTQQLLPFSIRLVLVFKWAVGMSQRALHPIYINTGTIEFLVSLSWFVFLLLSLSLLELIVCHIGFHKIYDTIAFKTLLQ